MPLANDSRLVVVSLVLSQRQWEQLRTIARLRATEAHEPSVSSIAREVVSLGLAALLRGPDSGSDPMIATTTAPAESH